jgi:hypothetical protein
MQLVVLLSLLCVCFADHLLHEEYYYYGPFTYVAGTHKYNGYSNKAPSDPEIPMPKTPLAVQFWGDWTLVDARTLKPFAENEMFLHHVMVYGSWAGDRVFLSGASQDKKTWGPNLPEGYLMKIPNMKQTVYLHLVNLQNFTVDVLVRYKIRYYHVDQVPKGTQWVKCVDLQYSLPITGQDPVNHPIYVHQFNVNNKHGGLKVVTAQGHLHQGGIDISIRNNATGEVWCTATALYSVKYSCYFEDWCPKCAQGAQPLTWNVYDTVTFCPRLDFRLEAGQKYTIVARYDNKCPYDSVMAWFFLYVAPDYDNPK